MLNVNNLNNPLLNNELGLAKDVDNPVHFLEKIKSKQFVIIFPTYQQH